MVYSNFGCKNQIRYNMRKEKYEFVYLYGENGQKFKWYYKKSSPIKEKRRKTTSRRISR